MGVKIGQTKKQVLQAVKASEELEAKGHRRIRHKPLPCARAVEELEPTLEPNPVNRAQSYASIQITSSKGKVYTITVPASYVNQVPRTWEWTAQRFRVADAIIEGIGIREVANMEGMPSFVTIYAWLQHPEFKEYVDSQILETGWASKRERIAGMARLVKKVFDKTIDEIDSVQLTDKSIGAVLSAIPIFAKHLAQEKEEFVEQSNVQQQTNITGTVVTASLKVDELLGSVSSEEQALIREKLSQMGDSVVNYITGATTNAGTNTK